MAAPDKLSERARLAEAAAARDPDDVGLLLAAAEACLRASGPTRAMVYVNAALALAPEEFKVLRVASGILGAANRKDEAIQFARRAAAAPGADAEARLHLGSLLVGMGEWREAIRNLEAHVASADRKPQSWRLLSVALLRDGDAPRALDAARRGASEETVGVDNRLHLASMLDEACLYDEALAVLVQAASMRPDDARVRRAASGIKHALGDLAGALSDAELAVYLAPGEASYAAHRDLLLREAGATTRSTPENGEWAPKVRMRTPRTRRPRPGFAGLVAIRARVVYALMLREIRTRFGHTRLGYAWALFEPLSHLLTLGSVFSLLNHAPPPVGDSLYLYYLTGLLPYLMFSHVSHEVMATLQASGGLLQLPAVKRTDALASRALLQLATEVGVGLITFTGVAVIGLGDMFADPLTCVGAVLLVFLFATGVGAINLVVQTAFPSYDTFYNSLIRLMYFGSGIYYSPIMMPDWVRDILTWNPMLQGIEMFRSGFFKQYDPHWLDVGYLGEVAVGALLVGLCLERATRRKLRAHP
jgi:ABC-type polysaccharide/polyol phosphate export permease